MEEARLVTLNLYGRGQVSSTKHMEQARLVALNIYGTGQASSFKTGQASRSKTKRPG